MYLRHSVLAALTKENPQFRPEDVLVYIRKMGVGHHYTQFDFGSVQLPLRNNFLLHVCVSCSSCLLDLDVTNIICVHHWLQTSKATCQRKVFFDSDFRFSAFDCRLMHQLCLCVRMSLSHLHLSCVTSDLNNSDLSFTVFPIKAPIFIDHEVGDTGCEHQFV